MKPFSLLQVTTHRDKAVFRPSHAYCAACCRQCLSRRWHECVVPVIMMSTRDSGIWSSGKGSIWYDRRLGIEGSDLRKMKCAQSVSDRNVEAER
jgi:hypothetical protein